MDDRIDCTEEGARQLLQDVDMLRKANRFSEARLQLAACLAADKVDWKLSSETRTLLTQKLALFTYKDVEVPIERRLQQALGILEDFKDDPLNLTENRETLGLAGSICKRRWRAENDRASLEQALHWYRRGAEQTSAEGWDDKQAYCAINLAFLLDLYARQLEDTAAVSVDLVESLRREACQWREKIVECSGALVEQQRRAVEEASGESRAGSEQTLWWSLVTLAEARLGQGKFGQAQAFLGGAAGLTFTPGNDQNEAMIHQLSELIQAKWPTESREYHSAWQVVGEMLADDRVLKSLTEGRFGLALSGGGFRAAFYHIGVLARLAELDLLRRVEVISCVSGGSILGAHYYLKVRKLLQSKLDADISQQDYIDLVKALEQEFLQGVQTNIRASILKNPLALLKMVFHFNYSRTHRLGELYEQLFYRPVMERSDAIYMDELLITPLDDLREQGAEGDVKFNPYYGNWQRHNKAPVLILNAANLNTGHNWQFTARWMGEAPWAVNHEIDANPHLKWFYYDEHEDCRVTLGEAVAASSCVPGLFRPLPLPKLYRGMTVQLVDGGLYDNQGTAALLDQNCQHILVSDASGQMATQRHPSASSLKVPLRAMNILESRLRSSQHRELYARKRSGLLESACHIHLRRDLSGGELEPVHRQGDDVSQVPAQKRTVYKLNSEYQQLLSEIRTDLDSFSDTEAYALMMSGYQMTKHYLPQEMPALVGDKEQVIDWQFSGMKSRLSKPGAEQRLRKHLKTGRQMLFKALKVSTPVRAGLALFVSCMCILLGWSYQQVLTQVVNGGEAIVSGSPVLCATVLLAALVGTIWLALKRDFSWHGLFDWLKGLLLGGMLSPVAWLLARGHLASLDKAFLKAGRIKPEPSSSESAKP